MIRRLRFLFAFAAVLMAALTVTQPAGATTVQRVVSPGGIEAWLVHEPSLPLVALNFAFVGGAAVDPADKPGVGYMVSSLLDDAFQQRLAERMWSWVAPGGGILWYDFTVDNPRNPDVRGVPLKRVKALFPRGNLWHRRITLAPPLARALCRVHPSLYPLFNALPPLRTHLLAWIEKPAP